MNSPAKLSPEAFARAAAFLQQARPLEQALFSYHFEHGSAAPVLAALQSFQNSDGGFHSLEADIGFSTSTVLSTCHALHLLRELHASDDHPLVQRALDFLLGTYDSAHEVWPIIPPHDNSQPHAPWWRHSEKLAENFGHYQDNPRPDVLACLLAFPSEKTAALRARVVQAILAHLRAAGGKVEMHGLVCYIRLHGARGLPDELKQELARSLPAWIDQNVERDPAKWTGYGLRPLDVAPLADSPWRALLAPALEKHLDFLIQSQAADGSWHPHWSWGDFFPEAWPAAKLKWQAYLTIRELRSLRSYGRFVE